MIDLHTHTNISDGSFTPTELIRQAKEVGLTAVAITDHDSIAGLDEAQEEADKLGVNFIKGIEFSTLFGENRLIHILGLGIDPQSEGFLKIYTNFRKTRAEKLPRVFEKIRSMGVEITPEAVQPFVSGGFMDRQAIAKYLMAKGYANNMKDSWMNYMDKVSYLEEELIQPEDAFRAIHAGGGKAFLAHFNLPIGLKGYSDEEARTRLISLKEMGLDGMEYYYPSFTEEDQIRCAKYIEDFGFLKSGGSDFHGANRPHIKLGIGEGDFNVPDELLENIIPGVKVPE